MSRNNKKQYRRRSRKGLCIYCGERPGFWGVRCIICRQNWAQDPLPFGARRALRLYREAEAKHAIEHRQVEARHAIRKFLASGEINGNYARALRLYAGIDGGKWRTYKEVGRIMKLTSQRVGKILLPSKIVLTQILGEKAPWRPVSQLDGEPFASIKA